MKTQDITEVIDLLEKTEVIDLLETLVIYSIKNIMKQVINKSNFKI